MLRAFLSYQFIASEGFLPKSSRHSELVSSYLVAGFSRECEEIWARGVGGLLRTLSPTTCLAFHLRLEEASYLPETVRNSDAEGRGLRVPSQGWTSDGRSPRPQQRRGHHTPSGCPRSLPVASAFGLISLWLPDPAALGAQMDVLGPERAHL